MRVRWSEEKGGCKAKQINQGRREKEDVNKVEHIKTSGKTEENQQPIKEKEAEKHTNHNHNHRYILT